MSDEQQTTEQPKEPPVYRYTGGDDGPRMPGVPRRDLYREDAERAKRQGLLADVEKSPLYEKVGGDTGATNDPTKMKRDDLNAYAAERGIENPEQYATKDELIRAIDAAKTEGGE